MPRRRADHFSTTSIRVLADALNNASGASAAASGSISIPAVDSVLATLADIDAEIHADMRQARAQLQHERTAHAHTRSELSAQVSLVASLRAQLAGGALSADGAIKSTNSSVDVVDALLNTACDCRQQKDQQETTGVLDDDENTMNANSNVMMTEEGPEHAATCARRRALMSVATAWPTTSTSTTSTTGRSSPSADGGGTTSTTTGSSMARAHQHHQQLCDLLLAREDACRNQAMLINRLKLDNKQLRATYDDMCRLVDTTTAGRRVRVPDSEHVQATVETTRRLDTLSIRLQRAGQAACDMATRVEERLKITALDVSNLRHSVTINTVTTATNSAHRRQVTDNENDDGDMSLLKNDVDGDVDVDNVIMPVSSPSSTVPHATALMTPRPRHQQSKLYRRRHHHHIRSNNSKTTGKDSNVETATSRALVDDDINNDKENAGNTMANRRYDDSEDDDIHSEVSSSSSSDAAYASLPNSPCRVRSPGMSMRVAPSLTPCSLSLSPVDEVDADVDAPPPPMMMVPMSRSSAVVVAGTDPRPSGVVRDEYDDATITVDDENERRILLERQRQRHRQHRHRRQAHEPTTTAVSTDLNMNNPMTTTINTVTSICPQPQPQPPSSSSPVMSSSSTISTQHLAQTEQHYRLATDELMRTMALQQDAHAKLRATVQELTEELTRIDPNALADVARLRREAGETQVKMDILDETVKQKDEEIQSLKRQLTKVVAEYDAVSVAHSYSNAELSKIRANDRRREKNKKLLQQQQLQKQQEEQLQQQQQQQQHQKLKQKQRSGHGHGAGSEGNVEGRHVRKIHFR